MGLEARPLHDSQTGEKGETTTTGRGKWKLKGKVDKVDKSRRSFERQPDFESVVILVLPRDEL